MADVQQLFDAAMERVKRSERSPGAETAHVSVSLLKAVLRELRDAAAQPELVVRLLQMVSKIISHVGSEALQGDAADCACTEAFRALREHASRADVAVDAFVVLASVGPAMSRGNMAALLREAVQTLGCDAGSARSKRDVARFATIALNNVLANNRPNKQSAVILGAVPALATAMARHPGDETLQSAGSAALHALGGRLEPLQDAAGALDAVVAAMRAYPASVTLQKNASLALSSVLHSNDALQVHFVRSGGLQLFVAALQRHGADADVCEAVCVAMTNLEGWSRPAMRAVAQESEVVAAMKSVVAAMRSHTTHAPTQEFGIQALGQLCGLPEVARLAADSHVLEAIVGGMGAHPKNVCVQTAGCLSLSHIFHHDHVPNRAAAVQVGAVPALVRALRTSYSRTALSFGAADHDSRYGAADDDSAGPKLYAIGALFMLYTHRADASDAHAPTDELLSGVPALHEGVMAVLHRMKCADGTVAEKRRLELVKHFTQVALFHATVCPNCADCNALRARGELCGKKGCAMSTPSSAQGINPGVSAGCMKVCARCKVVAYCCVEHQHSAWKAHKPACTALCSRRAAA